MTVVPLKIYFNDKGAPRSRLRSPRARSCTTSAESERIATGAVSAAADEAEGIGA